MSKQSTDAPATRQSQRPAETLIATSEVQSLIEPARAVLTELSARSKMANLPNGIRDIFHLARLVHALSVTTPPILSGTTFAAALPGRLASGSMPTKSELKVIEVWLDNAERLLSKTKRSDYCHAQNRLVLGEET